MPQFNNKGKNYNTSDKELLTKYGITYAMIAKWFGYSSANSFYGSKAKKDMLNGVKRVLEYMEKHQKV